MSEWRVYGCGSSSSSRSLQSSYEWIEGGFRLQLDFGYGALYRRCQASGDIHDAMNGITHLFLSHGHPDHIIDITRLAIALKYTPGYTPAQPIHLYATPPAWNFVNSLLDNMEVENTFESFFVYHPVEIGQTLEIEGHRLQFTPTCHKEGAVGVFIQSPAGRRIVYTGDTGLCESLGDYLHNLDLLVIEMSFLELEMEMHLNLWQVAELAGIVDPCALMPVHLYPELERHSDMHLRSLIAKWYEGDVFIARDGMSLLWEDTTASWKESNFLKV